MIIEINTIHTSKSNMERTLKLIQKRLQEMQTYSLCMEEELEMSKVIITIEIIDKKILMKQSLEDKKKQLFKDLQKIKKFKKNIKEEKRRERGKKREKEKKKGKERERSKKQTKNKIVE